MIIERTSKISNITRTLDIDVTPDQMHRINHSNELIQNVVPHLSDSDREFILTGITDEEWDEAFPEE